MKSPRPPKKRDLSTLADQTGFPYPHSEQDSHVSPARPRDPGEVAAEQMLQASFSANPAAVMVASQQGTAVVVKVPPAWAKLVSRAWSAKLHNGQQMENGDSPSAANIRWHDPEDPPYVAYVRTDESMPRKGIEGSAAVATTLMSNGRVVGFAAEPECQLPTTLIEAADAFLTIEPPNGKVLAEAIQNLAGKAPTLIIPEAIARKVSPDDLRLAIRPGQDPDNAVRRLITMVESRTKAPDITLDQMGGMNEAVDWGRALAKDLAAYRDGALPWSAVDRGVLLSGPPGCGKTTFARALAGTCQVPLVSASLGEWQAAGHLGDLLKSMRKTFADAKSTSPCILLVDEIDGFGDRSKFRNEYSDYWTQVVNSFLELVDGASGREGIVLVGATNNPERIDRAITRSGRLDRHIRIDLPDEVGLIQIMRHHLGQDLAEIDLSKTAKLALGGSGADVARWVRGAKRRGRQNQRAMTLDDLTMEIRGNAPEVSAEILHRCAVHEAGHAIAIALHTPGTLRHVSIRQTATTGGGVLSNRQEMDLATSDDIDQMLIMLLAGRAAEEVILGTVSSGAGGGTESDLAKATLMATSAITALGLGSASTPIWSGMPTPESIDLLQIRRPDIARQVEERLDRAYAVAKGLISANADAVLRIVDRLIEVEIMSGAEVAALLPTPAPQIQEAG